MGGPEDWLRWPPWRRRRWRRRRKGFFPSAVLFGRNGKSSTNREGESTKAKFYIFCYTIYFSLLALCFKNLDWHFLDALGNFPSSERQAVLWNRRPIAGPGFLSFIWGGAWQGGGSRGRKWTWQARGRGRKKKAGIASPWGRKKVLGIKVDKSMENDSLTLPLLCSHLLARVAARAFSFLTRCLSLYHARNGGGGWRRQEPEIGGFWPRFPSPSF